MATMVIITAMMTTLPAAAKAAAIGATIPADIGSDVVVHGKKVQNEAKKNLHMCISLHVY